LLCLWAIIARWNRLPQAFESIFLGAFQPKAVTGGILGSAFLSLRVGASRGAFTNEAGMGTAAISHGTANPAHPCDQGLMGILEVFLDTIVICTLTALVILTSGLPIPYGLDEGAALTVRAFSAVLGPWVSVAISVFLGLFAFATILGWSFYGIQCARYLLGEGSEKPFAFVMLLVSFLGVILGTGPVWMLSETVNGLMAIPSLFVLAVLSPTVGRLTKEYEKKSARRRSFGYPKREDKESCTVSPPLR
jgi:AGCS family alanine or glycine:cation symporter